MKRAAITGVVGIVFGFVIGRIGFGDWAEVHRMHLFADLRMFITFAVGVAGSMAGFFLLIRPKGYKRKVHKGTIPGSLLFGLGWAITGACPAIVLVQLGHGQLAGAVTGAGIVTGVWLQRKVQERFRWDSGTCDT
ncbi:MAG TPA: YeeE/YedE thiosulfate transporter family protein [Labilithrix sp.]|jgi:hypothetical protein|nr:YeeE/YedE thiosulfate transporter family protein [Labilithrix sp.]